MTHTLTELNPGVDTFKVFKDVYYREQVHEVMTSLRAYALDLALVYRGPTGSGKSTLTEHLAYLLGTGFPELQKKYGKELQHHKIPGTDQTLLSKIEEKTADFRDGFPLVSILGHEDLDADSLKGRPYAVGDDALWLNGTAKLAVQYGGLFYFDEPAEARPDSHTAIHSLSDYRRSLFVEGLGAIFRAVPSFGFIMSYNDRYQDARKRFKPSTSQRFVHIPIGYPVPDVEMEIVKKKTGLASDIIKQLITIAEGTRNMARLKHFTEGASPRLVINAALLIGAGEPPVSACRSCLAYPLTDEPAHLRAIELLIANQFKE